MKRTSPPLPERMKWLYSLILFISAISVGFAQPNSMPVFKNGDRVCFIGNSITNNGEFYNFVNLFYATRYPKEKVTFFNCGISGDQGRGVIKRMDSDILVHKPTWSVVMLGMNDVNRGLYGKLKESLPGNAAARQAALDAYKTNMETIIQTLLKNNSKILLQKPTIYDQTGHLPAENFYGVNDALGQCAAYIQEMADKYKLQTIDYYSILNRINKTIQARDSTKTIIGNDRVHPASPGHFIMAYEFLKTTGASPSVSEIVIPDAAKKNGITCKNCSVESVNAGKDQLQFTVKAESLPFPVAASAESALDLVPFTEQFNMELFQVKKLKKGNYDLLIDNKNIAVYSSEDLEKGINLALVKSTPQYIQALKVADLCTEYRKNYGKLRTIKMIELHHLPDSLHQSDTDVKKAFLDNYLEKRFTNHPQFEYYKNQFKNYLAFKAVERDLEQNKISLIRSIYVENVVKTHVYTVKRRL
jgi:lysophospholipase L1-like esterase